MMNRLLCAILLLLLIAPAAAQDAAPFSVLDEAAIFADGVTVIERLPDMRVNNETHELYYLAPDATEWESYLYPDAIQKDLQYRWEMRTRAFIFSEGLDYGLNSTSTLADWIFTPSVGLSLIEPQCGLERVTAAIYGLWVLEETENNDYRLCNTATSERTPVLGVLDFATNLYCNYNFTTDEGINVSPDGDWIIFAGCQDDWNIYAYHTPSEAVNFLGSVSGGAASHLFITDWYSNTEFFIANATGGNSVMASVSYSFMDVSQANSLIYTGNFPIDETTKRSVGIVYAGSPFNYAVQSFNPESRETEILTEFECRIELCYQSDIAVSDDLRYVAVAQDVPFAMGAGVLFVYDRVEDEVIYERPLPDTVNMSQMYWTFDNHLFIGNWIESEADSYNYTPLSLFDYLDQTFDLVIDNIDGLDFIVSPDSQFAFYHNQDGAWMIYDFETEQSYPIFVSEQCSNARLGWHADHIEVICGNTWHIRIDALDEENS